ncbi:hypothetical protein ACP4OV_018377 [Aristida adscensionis]
MRALRAGQTTMAGVNETGTNITHSTNSTLATLVYQWNLWETHSMVLVSFGLQIFLFVTGSLRRCKINGLLRFSIWLAYAGADLVAVYALGLFSQYEDKYKLGRQSFGDTLPFLWVPFLLVHLGGQDSITAFSLEDNNLWLRHLMNLVVQGSVALYVFWKSYYRINSGILIPAMLIFASGIMKYAERIWALKSASRDGHINTIRCNLPGTNNSDGNNSNNNSSNGNVYSRKAKQSYALQTVLFARGLFVGQTVLQLGYRAQQIIHQDFKRYTGGTVEREVIAMELGMMFDVLYTKASLMGMRRTGFLLRPIALGLMCLAFAMFHYTMRKDPVSRVNVTISEILFCGASFMEFTSILRAKIQVKMTPKFIGQFNLMDFSIHEKGILTVYKAINAFGLESLARQWRNIWHMKHVNGSLIVDSVLKLFRSHPEYQFAQRQYFSKSLNYILGLPFEHALYRLHLYTDFHISIGFAQSGGVLEDRVNKLKEKCEMLSNYMMYLMAVHPSMLPVSTAAEELGEELLDWVSKCDKSTKIEILGKYTAEVLNRQPNTSSPFEPASRLDLEQSLEDIKEMWVRLLVYAAGKCPGEQHARQLGNGGELLTFVWLLMLHHGLGDAATELRLFTSHYPDAPYKVGLLVATEKNKWVQQKEQPRYAFQFHEAEWVQITFEAAGTSGAAEQDEAAGTSGVAKQEEAAGTSGEARKEDDNEAAEDGISTEITEE